MRADEISETGDVRKQHFTPLCSLYGYPKTLHREREKTLLFSWYNLCWSIEDVLLLFHKWVTLGNNFGILAWRSCPRAYCSLSLHLSATPLSISHPLTSSKITKYCYTKDVQNSEGGRVSHINDCSQRLKKKARLMEEGLYGSILGKVFHVPSGGDATHMSCHHPMPHLAARNIRRQASLLLTFTLWQQ